jgi:hypothetical protein
MLRLCLAGLAFISVIGLVTAEPQPIPPDRAVTIAKQIIEAAGKTDPKIDVDCDQANGLYEQGRGGLMVIPRKDLKEDKVSGVEEPNGMPVGFLCLYRLTLLLDGKAVSADSLPTVTVKNDAGNDMSIITLRLAIKKESEENWKLLVFSKDKKPILSSAFRMDPNNSEQPISVSVKDIKENEGTLVVTLFGKYAADVKLTKQE